jgi:Gas vesicle synthesis protein GvpL/GvpF
VIGVYAVCDRPDLPLPAPLEGVVADGLVAVFARDVAVPAEPSPDDLWAHERLVERLMDDRAVLPMRYGTALPDPEQLKEALAARREEYAAALDRVRGRVELGLRAVAREPIRARPKASGRAYIEALAGEDERRHELHEPLAALAADDRVRRVRDPGEVLRAAYLVETCAVSRFRAEVRRLERAHPSLVLVDTGPWPPYSFVVGGA